MSKHSRLLVLSRPRDVAAAATIAMPAGASFIYGTRKVEGWTGNCCRVVRASDNAELDIGWVGDDWDFAAIVAFAAAGSSTCYPKTYYDMSGNGNDATQATIARMMSCQPNKGWRGKYGATAYDASTEFYNIPNTVSISSQSMTVYSVCAPQAGSALGIWQLGTTSADRLTLISATSQNGDSVLDTASFKDSITAFHNSQPTVGVAVGSASGFTIHANEKVSRSLAPAAAVTSVGGFWGKSDSTYLFYGEVFFLAGYNTAHDNTTVQGVKNQLYTAYDIRQNNTKRLDAPGDSVGWGQTNSGTGYTIPWTRYLEDSLSERIDIRNSGVPGRTLATIASELEKNQWAGFVRGGTNILNLWAGSNDIFLVGTTAAALYTTLTNSVQLAKQIGYYVIVDDIIARNDANSARQTEKTTFNSSVATNSAGADATVPLSATFNDHTNTTLYASDGIHLTVPTGYQTVASIKQPYIETGLAWTPTVPAALSTVVGDIPNAEMFIDSSDWANLTRILTDGALIYQANDRVNSYAATAPAGGKPLYLLTSGMNGKPAMRFDGSNDVLELSSGALATSAGANTLIVFFRSFNTGDATQALVAGRNASAGFRYGIQHTASAIQFSNFNASTTAASIAWVRDTNPHVAGFTRSGTNLTPFFDGTAGSSISNAGNTALATLTIGAQTSSVNRHNGEIACVIRANAALSNSQLNALCAPIAAYYGATWAGL